MVGQILNERGIERQAVVFSMNHDVLCAFVKSCVFCWLISCEWFKHILIFSMGPFFFSVVCQHAMPKSLRGIQSWLWIVAVWHTDDLQLNFVNCQSCRSKFEVMRKDCFEVFTNSMDYNSELSWSRLSTTVYSVYLVYWNAKKSL